MTNRTIRLSIPHRLTAAEAKSRIQSATANLKSQFGGKLADVREDWTGDHMEFRLGVLGQFVAGRVDVTPQTVDLQVDLPWVFAMLADKVRGRIEQEGTKLLEKK